MNKEKEEGVGKTPVIALEILEEAFSNVDIKEDENNLQALVTVKLSNEGDTTHYCTFDIFL